MAVRILLADDHGLIRQGLRTMLLSQPDIEIVGEAQDGRNAIELVHKLKPDIVITDIIMPNLNGVDATFQIVKQYPEIKVIALSGHSNHSFVTGMLKAGASGYVIKECLFEELLKAIDVVSRGGIYLSEKITSGIVSNYIQILSGTSDSPLQSFTEREREVLQLIAEGKSTKQIALELHVTTKAIEAQRRRIMEKLNSHNIADLVKCAIAGGLTSL